MIHQEYKKAAEKPMQSTAIMPIINRLKITLGILLTATMIFSLTACGNSESKKKQEDNAPYIETNGNRLYLSSGEYFIDDMKKADNGIVFRYLNDWATPYYYYFHDTGEVEELQYGQLDSNLVISYSYDWLSDHITIYVEQGTVFDGNNLIPVEHGEVTLDSDKYLADYIHFKDRGNNGYRKIYTDQGLLSTRYDDYSSLYNDLHSKLEAGEIKYYYEFFSSGSDIIIDLYASHDDMVSYLRQWALTESTEPGSNALIGTTWQHEVNENYIIEYNFFEDKLVCYEYDGYNILPLSWEGNIYNVTYNANSVTILDEKENVTWNYHLDGSTLYFEEDGESAEFWDRSVKDVR